MMIFTMKPCSTRYVVKVPSILQMNLVVDFIAAGLSFRQANAAYNAVKKRLECGNMGTMTEGTAATICRKVCAINLQIIKEFFKVVWAFSIGFDAASHAKSSYLDVRMRCFYKGDLHNLHLMAIPMRERHTGEYQFDLIVSLLEILVPDWKHKLIGVTTDGAASMTGRISGTATRLSNEVHSNVFRVWCGAHQLDLVVKKALRNLCGKDFLDMLKGVTNHLRRQQNLVQDMNNDTAKSFAETRWISMGPALEWLTKNEKRLVLHFDEKKPACTPPPEFWIIIAVVSPIMKRIEETFTAIQGKRTLVSEQREALQTLCANLMTRTRVKLPLTDEQLHDYQVLQDKAEDKADGVTEDSDTDSYDDDDDVKGFIMGSYYVLADDIVEAIDEIGGLPIQFKMDLLLVGSDSDKLLFDSVVATVAMFSLELITGIQEVVAERDMENNAAAQVPPVLPLELVAMTPRQFSAALTMQKDRWMHRFTQEEFFEVDAQYRRLSRMYRENVSFKTQLEANTQTNVNMEQFKKSWQNAGEGFELLQEFCGGLASVMAGTATVESDFSVINWTKDPNSSSMTDFTLESILHCNQHELLLKMFRGQ